MTLAVDVSFAGRVYPAGEAFEVGRRDIAAFAEATGATNLVYTDAVVARGLGYRDVVAPPTFAVVVAQEAESQYVADPAAGIDFAYVVHADERFTYHRPITAGDRLFTVLTVEKISQRGSFTTLTTRCDISDADEALVCTVWSSLVVRGES